jgi:hypothetical protein
VTESERQARIGALKVALAEVAERFEKRDDYIVELRELSVGPTEIAFLAKLTPAGIVKIIQRKAQS